MIGRADIEGSKSNVAMNAWLPQASYPCGNFSDTSCSKLSSSKGSIGPAFAVRIHTENQNQAGFCPFALREVSVLAEPSRYPCGNFSDTSCSKLSSSKGSIGPAFAVRIHTENQNQAGFCPFALREVSVLAEPALGHLRYSLTESPQPRATAVVTLRTRRETTMPEPRGRPLRERDGQRDTDGQRRAHKGTETPASGDEQRDQGHQSGSPDPRPLGPRGLASRPNRKLGETLAREDQRSPRSTLLWR